MKRFLCVITLVFAVAWASMADSVSSKQKEREALVKDIAKLESLISDANAKQKDAQREATLIGEKVRLQKKLLNELDKELYAKENEIKKIQKEITALQAHYDSLQASYNRLVLAAYKNRDTNLWYEFLFSSENVAQAFRRYAYFRNISKTISSQGAKVREAKDELILKKDELNTQMSSLYAAKDARAKEYNKLKKEETRYTSAAAAAKKSIAANKKKMAAQTKKLKALNAEIDKMLRSDAMGGSKTDPATAQLNKKFSDNSGKLPWPMEGYIIGNFHDAFDAYNPKVKREPRNGILIAGKPGAPVQAVFDGEVTMFGRLSNGSYGVIIRHGSYRTFYCGLSDVNVTKGQKVTAGQKIGTVRTVDGRSDLEFIVYFNNNYINPMMFLRK